MYILIWWTCHLVRKSIQSPSLSESCSPLSVNRRPGFQSGSWWKSTGGSWFGRVWFRYCLCQLSFSRHSWVCWPVDQSHKPHVSRPVNKWWKPNEKCQHEYNNNQLLIISGLDTSTKMHYEFVVVYQKMWQTKNLPSCAEKITPFQCWSLENFQQLGTDVKLFFWTLLSEIPFPTFLQSAGILKIVTKNPPLPPKMEAWKFCPPALEIHFKGRKKNNE